MNHNYYRIVVNMSNLSVVVIGIEGKKDKNIFVEVGVIKVHLEQNMTQKNKHKIIYSVQ